MTAPSRDAGADATGDVATDADSGADAADATDTSDADTNLQPARLRVQPTQIFFEGVEIGQTAATSISLANTGGSPLYITNVALTEREPEAQPELQPGENWLEGDSMTVEANTHAIINVRYAPDDHAIDRGFLTINSTDPQNPKVVVPIETVNAYPDVDVLETLRFGTVAVGESATEEVVIHNRGISPLTVDEILMAGDASFSVQMQAPYTTPAVIEKDDYIIFEVTYRPSDEEPDRAQIFVESNDPDQESFEIGVAGNEPTPCIQVSPTTLDFGSLRWATRSTKTLTVLNCSEARQLEISKIALSTDAGGAFEIDQAPASPVDIPPTSTAEIQIAASAVAFEEEALGVLVIESDDPEQPSLTIDLRARFYGE